jgi:hypothetical protein
VEGTGNRGSAAILDLEWQVNQTGGMVGTKG